MEIMWLSVNWHGSQYALLAIGFITIFTTLLCTYLHFGPSELSNPPDLSYREERGLVHSSMQVVVPEPDIVSLLFEEAK